MGRTASTCHRGDEVIPWPRLMSGWTGKTKSGQIEAGAAERTGHISSLHQLFPWLTRNVSQVDVISKGLYRHFAGIKGKE